MLIEAVRLVVTLAFTAAGFVLGRAAPGWAETATSPEASSIVGAVLGAGFGYVGGGLFGRLIRRGVERSPAVAERATGPELFAGAFGLIAGLLVGSVAAVPAIFLMPEVLGWATGALLVIVLAAVGARIFSVRSEDLFSAVGMGRRTQPPAEGVRCYVIDTSAAIDGRVLDLARAGLVRGEIRLAEFVIDELQGIADSGQINRRKRGRRGLDVLDGLSTVEGVQMRTDDRSYPEHPEVDAKLLALTDDLGATLVTTDHNLAKAAGLRGIEVLDVQAIGDSLRAGPISGDLVEVLIEREGTEPGQGVGYLEDGTMVVIEGAAAYLGELLQVEIASALRTSLGRMYFGKLAA
jgi:uncharacterized protein YacL